MFVIIRCFAFTQITRKTNMHSVPINSQEGRNIWNKQNIDITMYWTYVESNNKSVCKHVFSAHATEQNILMGVVHPKGKGYILSLKNAFLFCMIYKFIIVLKMTSWVNHILLTDKVEPKWIIEIARLSKQIMNVDINKACNDTSKLAVCNLTFYIWQVLGNLNSTVLYNLVLWALS